MAIGVNSVWEVRTGGNANNGGAFDATLANAGTDYTLQDTAQLTVTDGATSGANSTTLTSVTGGFTTAMIGNAVHIASGTNFTAGFYFITVRTDTNTVTLDRTPTPSGAGSGGNCKVGGGLTDPVDISVNKIVAGNTVWVKNGSYSYGTSGWNPLGGAAAAPTVIKGYNTTRGDLDADSALYSNFPIISCSTTTPGAVLSFTHEFVHVYNLAFNAFNATLSIAHAIDFSAGNCIVDHCKCYNWKTKGIYCNVHGVCVRRTWVTAGASGCTYGIQSDLQFGAMRLEYCAVTDNPCTGYILDFNSEAFIDHCISHNNTGSTSDGFLVDSQPGAWFSHCVSAYNGRDGIRMNGGNWSTHTGASQGVTSSILVGNAAYGLSEAGSGNVGGWSQGQFDYNFFYNNTSGARSGIPAGTSDVTGTADPLTSHSGSITSLADIWTNFGLNGTAGGGTACKAVAYPINTDIGAVQTAAAGGSSGGLLVNLGMGGGMRG